MRSRTAAVTSATRACSTSSTSSSCTCMMSRAPRRAVAAPGIHGDHGALDDVGGRALHRRVDRGALRGLLELLVARVDVRQIEPAAEHGLDVALRLGLRARLLHVALHAGIAREVQVDVFLRGAARDAELLGEAERAHAVDEAEVDRLGRAALVGGDLVERRAEHLGGGGLVDVLVAGEGAQQALRPPTGAP